MNIGFAGAAVLVALLYRPYWHSFKKLIDSSGVTVLQYNIWNELLNGAGNAIVFYCSLFIPVTAVFIANSFQPIFLLIIGFICARFFPNFSGETIGGKGYVVKIIAILLMLSGSVWLATSGIDSIFL